MREREYFALAAFRAQNPRGEAVLEDYVQELAHLYEMAPAEIGPRFQRFLDMYHRRTVKGTEEEWARLHTGDLEHSFIRISKPYRFRSAEMVPEALRLIGRCLRSGADRPSLLEFGGGFGNDAIVYARRGLEVHYADLVGLRNTDVVVRRFALRGLEIPVYDVGALPERRFDVITAMDVLEHVYDVEETSAQLSARIPQGGLLCCVNAFGAITYDGDHHDKNRVYLEVFGELMDAAGFEAVPANLPLTAYRRVAAPAERVEAELARVRPLLYSATRRHARERIRQLAPVLRGSADFDWERLPLESSLSAPAEEPRPPSRWEQLRAQAYAFAAPRAPRALKRAVWQRQLARSVAELSDTSDRTRALGALADWVSVLRIAEHRLHALSVPEPAEDH